MTWEEVTSIQTWSNDTRRLGWWCPQNHGTQGLSQIKVHLKNIYSALLWLYADLLWCMVICCWQLIFSYHFYWFEQLNAVNNITFLDSLLSMKITGIFKKIPLLMPPISATKSSVALNAKPTCSPFCCSCLYEFVSDLWQKVCWHWFFCRSEQLTLVVNIDYLESLLSMNNINIFKNTVHCLCQLLIVPDPS